MKKELQIYDLFGSVNWSTAWMSARYENTRLNFISWLPLVTIYPPSVVSIISQFKLFLFITSFIKYNKGTSHHNLVSGSGALSLPRCFPLTRLLAIQFSKAISYVGALV